MKSFFRLATLAAAAALVFVAFGKAAQADEGMWTFDNFPSKTVGVKYGFAPSPDWLNHVRLSSLRIAGGCSASFISPQGLVMTNHHCVVDCLEQISTQEQNFAGIGYSATTPAEERKCPDFELDQLVEIRDVTKEIQAATAGKTGEEANKALHAKEAELQQSCGSEQSVRCDVVSLYHGGVYDLYHYKRYNDVRLVFAPEFSVAQFGGDPDNFNFPRFDFDIGVLRAYEADKPVATKDYLHWSANGSKNGDLVFVSGNPGGTFRGLTTSQLAFERDVLYPNRIPEISERRGELEAFIARGSQQGRAASDDLFFLENGFKVYFGRQQALLDPQFFGSKMQEEHKLRAATAADPKLAAYVSAWDDIEHIQHVRSQLFVRATELSDRAFRGALLGNAITLVRAAAERTKPNSERLPQFTDQALVAREQELAAPAPVYPDLEELNLAFLFTVIRRDLGTDDAFVRKILGKESPEQLAHRLVSGTHLGDAKVREELYKGGQALIAASTDPMIRFAALINDDLLAVRKDYEARVDAPTRAAAEKIADARFTIFGTSVDPDATFTLRLTYGTVKGFEDAKGKFVQPYTAIGGLYERATGAPPYNLPESWLTAKGLIDPTAPMNFCTTNDTTGGNSGSPVIDKNANIVGLLFDGNIFSLGGDYGYDAAKNRSIGVDSRVLLEGMRKVYHLNRIVDEIEAAR
ncbi:MAG TPA: S46 family peptidase [Candidatus Acidoferrales bacterium]|nr:S46 family peptidase [Candidatus Acidoferrales bacterium]